MTFLQLKTWQTNTDNSLLYPYISKLGNDSYLLNNTSTNYNILEKYVNDIASFHIENKDLHNETPYFIEFCIFTSQNKLIIDTNKQKQSPVVSIITCINDNAQPFVFTDIDVESYKYKDIPDENSFVIFIPKQNTHIVFDSSKYYGFLYNIDETNKDLSPLFIKINVWDNSPVNINIYRNECIEPNKYSEMNIININNTANDTIIDDTLFYKLLYDFKNKSTVKIEKLMEKYTNTSTSIINIKHTVNKNVNYLSLVEMYGNITDDIIPFLNDTYSILPTNRFNQNKIVTNILSKDVCYWIINECEKNTFIDSPYSSYINYLNIEKIPSILNFILFVSNYWLNHIRKVYDIEKVDINIKDIFISKLTNNVNNNCCNKDPSFLTLNIQLNDCIDYIGGYIQFDNDDKIKLNQGDMLVYNGQKLKTNGIIENGIRYVLVLLLDIKI